MNSSLHNHLIHHRQFRHRLQLLRSVLAHSHRLQKYVVSVDLVQLQRRRLRGLGVIPHLRVDDVGGGGGDSLVQVALGVDEELAGVEGLVLGLAALHACHLTLQLGVCAVSG